MLPLWWPRSACIYCGHPLFHPPAVIRWAKSKGVPASARTREARPERLACLAHRDLVPLDPLLQP